MSAAPLSAEHAAVLESMLARLIPSDELGPGAREAGVAGYVEAALRDWHSRHAEAYAAGLGALEQRARTELGRGFAMCEPAEQDALLDAVERDERDRPFFELARTHAIEGMFGDPRWGGNAGGAGWELLGYAGPRTQWSAQEQELGASEAGATAR